eukprot:325260_1
MSKENLDILTTGVKEEILREHQTETADMCRMHDIVTEKRNFWMTSELIQFDLLRVAPTTKHILILSQLTTNMILNFKPKSKKADHVLTKIYKLFMKEQQIPNLLDTKWIFGVFHEGFGGDGNHWISLGVEYTKLRHSGRNSNKIGKLQLHFHFWDSLNGKQSSTCKKIEQNFRQFIKKVFNKYELAITKKK